MTGHTSRRNILKPLTTQIAPLPSRAPGIIGASLVVALLVAGCSSPAHEPTKAGSATPTSSPTPTPTAEIGAVEAPQSAEEAIAGAESAAQIYLNVRAEIEVEHPEDSSSIDAIAMGDVATSMHGIASNLLEDGTISTGHYGFDVTEASAGDLTASDGTVYPFGAVALTGCFITTEMNSTNADGTPAAMNSNRRGMARMIVFFVAADKTWLLSELGATDEVNVPC